MTDIFKILNIFSWIISTDVHSVTMTHAWYGTNVCVTRLPHRQNWRNILHSLSMPGVLTRIHAHQNMKSVISCANKVSINFTVKFRDLASKKRQHHKPQSRAPRFNSWMKTKKLVTLYHLNMTCSMLKGMLYSIKTYIVKCLIFAGV